MTHTPGRMNTELADSTGLGHASLRAPGESGAVVANVYGFAADGKDSDSTARRLAALWNMADELGLSTEDIEAGCVQKIVRKAIDAHNAVSAACVANGWPEVPTDDISPFTKPA